MARHALPDNWYAIPEIRVMDWRGGLFNTSGGNNIMNHPNSSYRVYGLDGTYRRDFRGRHRKEV